MDITNEAGTIRTWMKRALLLIAVAGSLGLGASSTFAAGNAGPCAANAESRQLDFWVGDWTITYPGGLGTGNSMVYLDLDKCKLVESWDGGEGHNGKNMFAYSPEDKSWHGMFADNRGHVHVFVDGKVVAGSAEFDGPSRNEEGKTVLNRIRVTRVSENKVEQVWEKSEDNGATWTTVFHGEYSRKNPV